MKWYQDREAIRMWARNFIMLFFFGMFAYIIIKHTGYDEESIKPMTIFGFLAGVILSKVIDWFFVDNDIKT